MDPPRGGASGDGMWRILVLGVLKQGLGCDFDAQSREPSRDGAGDAGPQRLRRQDALLSDNCRNVSLMRPELLAEVGRLVVESGHAVSLAGGCAGGVTRSWWRPTCIIPPIWVYCGMGCGVSGDGASGGGTRGGRLAANRHLGKRVKEGFNPVRSSRRLRRIWGCAGIFEPKPSRHWSGVEEAECRLIRGYIDHARRQIDQVDRRLLQGERIPHQEKGSPSSSRTRAGSRRARRAGRWNWGLRSSSRTSTSSSSITSCCGRRHVEVAVPMILPKRCTPIRMCSFDRGFHSRNNRTTRRHRVERATRQGTTASGKKPRSSPETAASGGGVGDQLAGASRSRHPRHRGLRAHGCAVGAGGECTAWGGATAGAGRQETTQTTPPDRRRRCPHFSL